MKKLLSLLFIFTFIVSGCSNKNIYQTHAIEDETILITSYKEKPDTGRPRNETTINNIFIALNELKIASNYQSTSKGSVVAKKGNIPLATQEINNLKTVTPTATFSESISISPFVKVAEQLYLSSTQVLKRKAKKVTSSSNISWDNNVTKLDYQEYLKQYGYSAKDPTRYIINEDTIISDIEIINDGKGRKYTYKFNLDPIIAPYFYKSTVKLLSDSSKDPIFETIEMTMTFDYKWRMTQITVNEVYEIEVPALGKITCYSTLTETFKNINRNTNIEEEAFFKKYL